MLVLDVALLSCLLPAAVLARPNAHERLHHKRGAFDAIHPSGINGASSNPHPSMGPTAPFPANNVTTGGPSTATGSVTSSAGGNGPVTISSIITVVPLPPTSGQSSLPNSPQSGIPGSPSGSPAGPGGSGGSDNSDVCGPATVTVTQANTVTVTVPAAGSSSGIPVKDDTEGVPDVDAPSSNKLSSNSAVETPAVQPETKDKPVVKPKEDKTSADQPIHDAQPAAKPNEEKEAADTVKADTQTADKPAEEKPASKPEADAQPVAKPAEEKHAAKPQQDATAAEEETKVKSPVTPKVEEKQSEEETKPAAKVEAAENHPQSSPVVQEKSEKEDSTRKSTGASTPKKSSSKPTSGGGKGILYSSLEEANSMTGMSWGCNWDSSPVPKVGKAQGKLNFDFVPQLWGPDLTDPNVRPHVEAWPGNSKGFPYVMAFNEPNIDLAGGGCGPMEPDAAVGPYEENLQPNKDAGQKIVSPCVSNNAPDWLDSFISQTILKPDAVCFHWYGQSAKELESVVKQFQEIQQKHSIDELWMSEWAFNIDVSSDEAQAALEFLEGSAVNRWAYNSQRFASTPTVKAAYVS